MSEEQRLTTHYNELLFACRMADASAFYGGFPIPVNMIGEAAAAELGPVRHMYRFSASGHRAAHSRVIDMLAHAGAPEHALWRANAYPHSPMFTIDPADGAPLQNRQRWNDDMHADLAVNNVRARAARGLHASLARAVGRKARGHLWALLAWTVVSTPGTVAVVVQDDDDAAAAAAPRPFLVELTCTPLDKHGVCIKVHVRRDPPALLHVATFHACGKQGTIVEATYHWAPTARQKTGGMQSAWSDCWQEVATLAALQHLARTSNHEDTALWIAPRPPPGVDTLLAMLGADVFTKNGGGYVLVRPLAGGGPSISQREMQVEAILAFRAYAKKQASHFDRVELLARGLCAYSPDICAASGCNHAHARARAFAADALAHATEPPPVWPRVAVKNALLYAAKGHIRAWYSLYAVATQRPPSPDQRTSGVSMVTVSTMGEFLETCVVIPMLAITHATRLPQYNWSPTEYVMVRSMTLFDTVLRCPDAVTRRQLLERVAEVAVAHALEVGVSVNGGFLAVRRSFVQWFSMALMELGHAYYSGMPFPFIHDTIGALPMMAQQWIIPEASSVMQIFCSLFGGAADRLPPAALFAKSHADVTLACMAAAAPEPRLVLAEWASRLRVRGLSTDTGGKIVVPTVCDDGDRMLEAQLARGPPLAVHMYVDVDSHEQVRAEISAPTGGGRHWWQWDATTRKLWINLGAMLQDPLAVARFCVQPRAG